MPAKLAYIVSAGHSGSTLLDLIIGSIPGAFSTGEVTYLPWQLYRRGASDPTASRQDVCTCFASFRECPVWKSIMADVNERAGFDAVADPFRLRMALLTPQRYVRGAPLGSRLGRLAYRGTSWLAPADWLWRRAWRRVVDHNWLVFDAICRTQGASVVVDSSKDPLRLRFLFARRPADVYCILLVRDPRGVAYSAQKREGSAADAPRKWMRYHQRALPILRRMRGLPILRVQYEDVCRNPAATRRRIAQFLNLPEPPDSSMNGNQPHMIAGNPSRYRWNGQIRLDDAWVTQFTGDDRRAADELHARLGPDWPRIGTVWTAGAESASTTG